MIRIRGVIAQHTCLEHTKLYEYAWRKKSIVEIGVAEGASALALRKAAAPDAILYLIDSYSSGRKLDSQLQRIIAHRHVNRSRNAEVCWVRDFSYNVVKDWKKPIDFLFIDGDHSHKACLRDWIEWSPFVIRGGIVAFHDGRIFQRGWTSADMGSVKVVQKIRNDPRSDFQVIDEVDSMVFFRKNGQ